MVLASVLAFGSGVADGATVYAAAGPSEADVGQMESENEAEQTAAGDDVDVYDEEKVLEDVTIPGLDVPYETIEWGGSASEDLPRAAASARDHEIILVLDVSGSMSGIPMTQLKKACYNFVDDILEEDPAAGIGIVTFESGVRTYTFGDDYFTSSRNQLRSVIKSLSALGGTAMDAGLSKADEIMENYGMAGNKFIIQMADGEPNSGPTYFGSDARYSGGPYIGPDGSEFEYGSDGYCSAIYNTFSSIERYYRIFSLGFFHSLSGTSKQFAAMFMNDIQNTGYFEVEDASRLTFSFENIAENINSDKIAFNKSSLVMPKGEKEKLDVLFSASYTSTDKSVTWISSDPAVAEVDGEGWVSAMGIGKCEITAEAGGYKIVCPVTVAKAKLTEQISITVEQNENPQSDENKNVASAGAVITYDGEEFKTDAKGKVRIPNITEGEITISKPDFVTRTIPASFVKDGKTFVLQKVSENPIINAVWVDSTDVLAERYEIDHNSMENKVFSADMTWSESGRKRLQLAQETIYVDFTENTLSVVLFHEGFDVTDDIYIIAEDNAGHVTKQKLQLEGPADFLDGFEFSLGDKIQMTLPDDIPLIGGSKVGLDLEVKNKKGETEKNGVVPISISVKKRKVKAAIGIDVKKIQSKTTTTTDHKTGKTETETEKYVTDFIQEVKNIKKLRKTMASSARAKVKDLKKKWEDGLTKTKGSFGVDAQLTVTGYIEAYIDKNGHMQITESGIVVLGSADAKWSGNHLVPVWVFTVPVYWEAAVSGEVEAAFDMYYSGKDQKYTPGGSISGKVEGKVGGGVGNTNIVTAGGGGKLTFAPSAEFYSDRKDHFALTITINFYFKVTALKIYENTWEPDWAKASWSFDNGARSDKAGGRSSDLTEEGLPTDMYDASAYSLADLDYILEPADLSFDVYASGRNAYVVLQNASSRIDPQSTVTDLKDVQVKAAILDSTGKFQKASVLNINTDVLAALPVVFGNGDNVTAAWVENTGADWFLTNGDNTIYTSTLLDGASWSQPQAFVDDLAAVTSLDGDMDEQGQTYLAYSVDQDKNLETSADQEVFVSKGWVTSREFDSDLQQSGSSGSDIGGEQDTVSGADADNGSLMLEAGITDRQDIENENMMNEQAAVDHVDISTQQVTANDTCDSYVQFADHTLYWVRNGNVFYTDPTVIEEQAVLADGQELLFQTYSIVGQGENKVVLFSVKDELKSSVKGVFYQSGVNAWGNPIALTDSERPVDIPAFSAIRTNKNTIELLCSQTKVIGSLIDGNSSPYHDLYGQTDLELMQYNKRCETSVEDSYYEKEKIAADGALPVTLSVTNNDIEPISGVAVKVTDGTNLIQEVDVAVQVLSGCTENITFNCETREEYIGSSLYLQCAPLENRDHVASTAETIISLDHENIAQENLKWSYISKDKVSITADVKNLGFTRAEQVSASLHKDTPESGALETISLGAIDSMDTAEVSFEVPYKEDAVYYIALAVPENDQNEADNTDFVVLKAQENNTGRTLTALSVLLKKRSYTVGETLDLSGLSVEGVYSDGTRSDVKGEAVIDTSKVKMSRAGTYTITIGYGGRSVTVQVKVSDTIKKGSKVTVNKLYYTVTASSGKNKTVMLTGCKDKRTRKTLTVPAQITVSKTKYNVTAVQAKAFSGCKKLTRVTIGKKVTTIGSLSFANCKKLKRVKCGAALKQIRPKAFSGCKKLSKITIRSKKLTKVGKNACKGIATKAEIRVPAPRLKVYRRLFSKKTVGYKKGWKIRK